VSRRKWSGFGEDLIEQVAAYCAGDRLDRAVCFDDRHGRLKGDVEAVEHDASVIADLRERQAVLVDESLKVVVIAGPCDTDEVDCAGEFLCCCLDRGSFTIAGASSGRPKPEQCGLAGQGGSIKFAAADQRCGELQGGRRGHNVISGGRVASGRLGGCRFGGCRFGDWNVGCGLSCHCGAVIG
jgi:hypothetical protein